MNTCKINRKHIYSMELIELPDGMYTRKLIKLDGQTYNATRLADRIYRHALTRVPHSHRQFTPEEQRRIVEFGLPTGLARGTTQRQRAPRRTVESFTLSATSGLPETTDSEGSFNNARRYVLGERDKERWLSSGLTPYSGSSLNFDSSGYRKVIADADSPAEMRALINERDQKLERHYAAVAYEQDRHRDYHNRRRNLINEMAGRYMQRRARRRHMQRERRHQAVMNIMSSRLPHDVARNVADKNDPRGKHRAYEQYTSSYGAKYSSGPSSSSTST